MTAQRSATVDAPPWRRLLMPAIVVSLLCAPWSWFDDGITPSWIVYPLVLLVGAWRVREGHGALFLGVAALVFLLVHLPWTWAAITGAETNPLNREAPSSPVQWLLTLFVIPVIASLIGWGAWVAERRSESVRSG